MKSVDLFLKIARAHDCWCEFGIGNPMVGGHSDPCREIQAYIRNIIERDPSDVFVTTANGHRFYFLDMERSEISIDDIINHLARTCRYVGATRVPNGIYSTGQHSVLCATWVMQQPVSHKIPEVALAALLHDAGEYVLGDMSGPLKILFPDYKDLERKIDRLIERRFGLSHGIMEHPVVKEADACIRQNEANAFCHGAANLCAADYNGDRALELSEGMFAWSVEETEQRFFEMFEMLYLALQEQDA
jgi:5'-deoxynucleotidase YfbR-like HD superfamily hydrolase